MICLAPATVEVGVVPVRVKQFSTSDDSALISDTTAFFRYHSPLALSLLSPVFGPSSGGTEVGIHGAGFVDSALLQCRWGDPALGIVVPARFVSAALIVCITPSISVHFPGIYDPDFSAWHTVPSGDDYHMAVQVTNNGVDWSADEALFQYRRERIVSSLQPSKGEDGGGTMVTVFGDNFRDTQDVKCRFGSVEIGATWLSEKAVECEAPEHVIVPNVQRICVESPEQKHEVQRIRLVAVGLWQMAATPRDLPWRVCTLHRHAGERRAPVLRPTSRLFVRSDQARLAVCLPSLLRARRRRLWPSTPRARMCRVPWRSSSRTRCR